MSRDSRGQATVELALLLPVVALLLLAVLQGALLVRDRLFLINAARVAARAAALRPDEDAVVTALRDQGVAATGLVIALDAPQGPRTVGSVQIGRTVTRVPVVGVFLGDLMLHERLAFLAEEPEAPEP